MPADLSREDQFLLREYDSAVKLTYHIDELRNSLTGFVLTFAGVAVAGITLLLKGETVGSLFKSPPAVVAVLLLLVASIQVIAVCILARLRRAQIEHFRIINNVREHFLGTNYQLWNVVQLSSDTLPKPNRKSGTYFWTALLISVGSYLLGFASHLFLVDVFFKEMDVQWWSYLFSLLVFAVSFFLQDRLYIKLARPPEPKQYSAQNLAVSQLAKPVSQAESV